MIRPFDPGASTKDLTKYYVPRHSSPVIPQLVEDRNDNGIYGFAPGSRKRGLWLNQVEDRSTDPNVR